MPEPTPARSGGFRPGVKVRIIGGTFVGREGRIMTPDEAREHRMVRYDPNYAEYMHNVMLSLFGQEVPIQLHCDDIDYA